MKLEIKGKDEDNEERCVFWLEKSGNGLTLKSQKEGCSYSLNEFTILPDGSWVKNIGGNLDMEDSRNLNDEEGKY